MIGLLTDSTSQLPDHLRQRYDVEVVPITVIVDGTEHREGVDLDADRFYAQLTDPPPVIKTAQPAPGEFVDAYQRLRARGADQIVAVLIGTELSGCVNSATVAADLVDTPVHIIDTGTTSFGISACLWELAELLRRGHDLDAAIAEAQSLVPRIRTSVLLQGLEFARAGGRIAADLLLEEPAVVYAGVGTDVSVVGAGVTTTEIDQLLLTPFAEVDEPIRAAVCLADPATLGFCEALETSLAQLDHVVDVTRYRVGPSVAAHTGPGTAGGFFWPALDR